MNSVLGPTVGGNSSALSSSQLPGDQGSLEDLMSGNEAGVDGEGIPSLSCHWLGLRHLATPAIREDGYIL